MDLRESIANQTDFALRLSKHVGSTVAAGGNLALSPVSIHAILTLVAAGSRGPTLDQILSFVRSTTADDLNALTSQVVELVLADGSAAGGPRISVANGVWVDSSLSLKGSFKEVVASSFKAEAKAVDFQSKVSLSLDHLFWVNSLKI